MFRKTIIHISIFAALALAALAITATSALAGGKCRTCGAPATTNIQTAHTTSSLAVNSQRLYGNLLTPSGACRNCH